MLTHSLPTSLTITSHPHSACSSVKWESSHGGCATKARHVFTPYRRIYLLRQMGRRPLGAHRLAKCPLWRPVGSWFSRWRRRAGSSPGGGQRTDPSKTQACVGKMSPKRGAPRKQEVSKEPPSPSSVWTQPRCTQGKQKSAGAVVGAGGTPGPTAEVQTPAQPAANV